MSARLDWKERQPVVHFGLTGSATSSYLDANLFYPERKHRSDAGFDCRTTCDFAISVGEQRTVPLGFRVAIPAGWVGLLCSRSGMARNLGIQVTNAPGIIDNGYRGEMMAIVSRVAPGADAAHFYAQSGTGDAGIEVAPAHFEAGDRIAQLVIVPCLTTARRLDEREWNELLLDNTDRGAAGFGSTGKG